MLESATIVELTVVGVQVRLHIMTFQQINKVLCIRYETAWTQNGALWNTAVDWIANQT